MTQRMFVAILTVAVFVAGYAARLWTEPHPSVPPVPAALAKGYAAPADKKNERQVDRAKLLADIQKVRPQIEAYSAQVQEIENEFDREFVQLLNPEQREKFAANQKKWAERYARWIAKRDPLTDEDIQREKSMSWIYWQVTVQPRLEQLTKDYTLDAVQQARARALLAMRRNKFIALYDATPPPSIRLSRLAPLIERVSAPASAKETAK